MRKLTVLAAGVLLVSVAEMPGAANAEPLDWEAVARCESGGDWTADNGQGGYGGLRISLADWGRNGGVGLPSQASPQQQIAVAQRIMASRGPGAWAGCLTPAGSPGAAATVGSLTHYLTALSDGGPATAASAD